MYILYNYIIYNIIQLVKFVLCIYLFSHARQFLSLTSTSVGEWLLLADSFSTPISIS